MTWRGDRCDYLPWLEARLCGAGVCVLGLLVTIWARWTLAGNWSSEVAFKKGHELVRTGPYSGSHRPEARSPKS